MLLSEMIARLGELYLEHGDLPVRDGSNNQELTGANVRNGGVYLEQNIELNKVNLERALIYINNWIDARGLRITK